MSKNLHKRLRELQRVAALHQNQAVAPIGAPVISDTTVSAAPSAAATMAIGTPAHYQVIRKDLIFVVILMLVMVALLLGCWWLVNNTALAQWIVNLGSSIR
ncbi:MAG: hypothetical protein WC553_00020 [Patescibacteria group bacterium]|jgi:ribose/xylose/arabinose/galactoside ABC-type transport system permease subunit